MAMLVHGAGDRTEARWRALLTGAGFAVRRIVPVGEPYVVTEARRAVG